MAPLSQTQIVLCLLQAIHENNLLKVHEMFDLLILPLDAFFYWPRASQGAYLRDLLLDRNPYGYYDFYIDSYLQLFH